jgi:hemerythrin-like domain-containing protein
MVNVLAEWHDEHVRFIRLLDILGKQLAAFHAGEDPDYELMRDIVQYLQHFADRFHHPRENVAFSRLAERDPGMGMAVSRLLQEHRVIAKGGEELMRHLDEIEADVMVSRAAVEAAVATYLVYYRHHLGTEEAQIIPRAAALLTPEDWAAVAAAVPVGPDPLFGKNAEAGYETLRRHIELEAQHLAIRAPA